MTNVYVVTNVDYGWDCVVDIVNADSATFEEVLEAYPKKHGHVIQLRTVSTEIEID